MKVSDIMTHKVAIIRPDASVQDAARAMKAEDTGFIPVCDGERIMGTITDRDIVIRLVSEGKNPSDCKVQDAMSTDIAFIHEDQDVRDAARLMEERQIRRLVVVDGEKRLCGVVSLGDISVQSKRKLSGEILREVSQRSEVSQRGTSPVH